MNLERSGSRHLVSHIEIIMQLIEGNPGINSILVIVLTKAAPALVIKWSGEYFLKWLCIGNNRLLFLPFFLFNRFGYLNQSGNFRTKIEAFHYTQCIH